MVHFRKLKEIRSYRIHTSVIFSLFLGENLCAILYKLKKRQIKTLACAVISMVLPFWHYQFVSTLARVTSVKSTKHLEVKKYCPFFTIIIMLCKHYSKKMQMIAVCKNNRKKNDIFSANFCATEKLPVNICRTQKKWQNKLIFSALIIALQKNELQIFAERK